MNELVTISSNVLPATDPVSIDKLEDIERQAEAMPQVDIATTHTLHDGVYTRTITIPAGVFVVGVMVKIPTTLIVSGDTTVVIGDTARRLTGYHVFTGAAMRKQAAYAHSESSFTMLFKTDAKSVAEAEAQFTDEADRLMSNRCENYLIQPEDFICLV